MRLIWFPLHAIKLALTDVYPMYDWPPKCPVCSFSAQLLWNQGCGFPYGVSLSHTWSSSFLAAISFSQLAYSGHNFDGTNFLFSTVCCKHSIYQVLNQRIITYNRHRLGTAWSWHSKLRSLIPLLSPIFQLYARRYLTFLAVVGQRQLFVLAAWWVKDTDYKGRVWAFFFLNQLWIFNTMQFSLDEENYSPASHFRLIWW